MFSKSWYPDFHFPISNNNILLPYFIGHIPVVKDIFTWVHCLASSLSSLVPPVLLSFVQYATWKAIILKLKWFDHTLPETDASLLLVWTWLFHYFTSMNIRKGHQLWHFKTHLVSLYKPGYCGYHFKASLLITWLVNSTNKCTLFICIY